MSAMAEWATDVEGIKADRKALGLSQVALAAKLGVHPVTVARWETGARRVPEMAVRFVHMLAERQAVSLIASNN